MASQVRISATKPAEMSGQYFHLAGSKKIAVVLVNCLATDFSESNLTFQVQNSIITLLAEGPPLVCQRLPLI
jgi:hypothetical protein